MRSDEAPVTADESPSAIQIFPNRSGEMNLRVRGEGGKWITYYSSREIGAEAALFASRFSSPEGELILLLGLGLGYHLRAILAMTGRPVIVVEKEEVILEAARATEGVQEALNRSNVYLVAGGELERTWKEISRIQIKTGFRNVHVVKHPPSLRSFPGFYRPLVQRLEEVKKTAIGSRLRYEKFKEEKLKILLINSQYLMMGELVHAIGALGHELRTLIIAREAEIARDEFMSGLLKILVDFQPDFILTVNHLGFDREGIVTDFLTALKIPFASWYVDSPMLIIRHYERNLSPYCAIFLWDRDYVGDMKALGFDKVHFLPLGTDPTIFRPLGLPESPSAPSRAGISFVGNSMVNPVKKKMERLGLGREHKGRIEEIGRAYALAGCRNVSELLEQSGYDNDPLVQGMSNGRRVDFEALLMCQGTLYYRLQYIRALASLKPVIRGDDGWRSLLPGSFQTGPELLYYYDLNGFYNLSDINFNVTSTQMRTAVNQRVFDVPAAGGFLLTDHKEQLEELMEVGHEVICFRREEEARDLARFYLTHDGERQKIAARGRRRVLADHTYTRRLEELCRWMRKHFGG